MSKEFTDAELQTLFRKFDKDNSGHIDQNELGQILTQLGFLNMSGRRLQKMFEMADKDKSGRVDFAEFKGIVNQSTMMDKAMAKVPPGALRTILLVKTVIFSCLGLFTVVVVFTNLKSALNTNPECVLERESEDACPSLAGLTAWRDDVKRRLSVRRERHGVHPNRDGCHMVQPNANCPSCNTSDPVMCAAAYGTVASTAADRAKTPPTFVLRELQSTSNRIASYRAVTHSLSHETHVVSGVRRLRGKVCV